MIIIASPPVPFYIAKYIVKGLFNILLDVNVKGKNNIPQNRNYIIISNHLNWSDPFFILMSLPSSPKIIFIAENEGIYDKKGQKRVIDFMGKPIVPIERDNPRSRIKALRAMVRIIKNGNNLAVFPEGRLGHAEGEIFPFHLGVFSIAKKMEIPILPIAIAGTKKLSFRNPVEIQIGELIRCKEKESEEDFGRRAALKMRKILPNYPGEGPFPNTMNWFTDLFQGGLRPFNGEYNLIIKRRDDDK